PCAPATPSRRPSSAASLPACRGRSVPQRSVSPPIHRSTGGGLVTASLAGMRGNRDPPSPSPARGEGYSTMERDSSAGEDTLAAIANRNRALAAVCDTFVPGGSALPSASALGIPARIIGEILALDRPALIKELDQVLDL